MKKNIQKIVNLLKSLLLVAILIISPPVFSLKAAINLDNVSVTKSESYLYLENLKYIAWDRYTGNEGDSFIQKVGSRNGNIGADGKFYLHGIEIWLARWNYTPEISWVWATYEIPESMTNLTGTLTYLSESYNRNNFSTLFEIYGDSQSIYSKRITEKDTAEIEINLSLKGYKTFTIMAKDEKKTAGGTSLCFGNAMLKSSSTTANESDDVTVLQPDSQLNNQNNNQTNNQSNNQSNQQGDSQDDWGEWDDWVEEDSSELNSSNINSDLTKPVIDEDIEKQENMQDGVLQKNPNIFDQSSENDDANSVDDRLEYTIIFNSNGGDEKEEIMIVVNDGDTIKVYPKVKRKDYLLEGWYTEYGIKFDTDTPITEDLTLYAHWQQVSKPDRVLLQQAKSKKAGELTLTYEKCIGVDGYEITYSTNKKFLKKNTKKVKTKVPKKNIMGLKLGKKYYIRVRAYKIDSAGKKVFGYYSEVKNVKVKKR